MTAGKDISVSLKEPDSLKISVSNTSLQVSLKETASGGFGTSNYEKLKNKPSINSVELIGNKTSDDLKLQGKIESITAHDIDVLMYGGE